ncbi:hypothetical protein L6164_037541 [Bauhinia variegata]|uniref:Uncharacterized protein n=1 Tax=Bauhinia variegata TaxID=167791 RepID=A0ACB9KKA7_BAUVA|nr:hypothetical protein L6164_037541 [Bauhinia variegata]
MVYGEAGSLLEYFQHQLLEHPSFYHTYQMDFEEKMTNVFWANAKMILDYEYFGDVVSLDTTYCTNRAHRPLALFSGFNHHRGTVIFGVALLYDETTKSFKWLFEIFLKAHGNRKPKTLFTDQDQAMAKALVVVMSETRHGLCTWHLMQNGIKHLVTKFNVNENNWVKSMYAIKEKWAACHMKEAFTLGMRSTQLSESLNSNFDACMGPNVNVIQFFNHFERVIEEKQYNELIYEYESRHKLARLRYEHSPILLQLTQVYTTTVFNIFQNEFALFLAACIRERIVSQLLFEYVVTLISEEGEWRVVYDPVQTSISCNSRKFETIGILYCHALKVFEANDVKFVPDQYILNSWTRHARNGIIHDVKGNEVVEDPKLSSTQRYRQLCSTMIRLAVEVSTSEKLHKIVKKGVQELCKHVMEIQLEENILVNDDGGAQRSTRKNVTQSNVRVIERWGWFKKLAQPGFHFFNPFASECLASILTTRVCSL